MTSHLAMFAASRLVRLSPTDVVIIVFYFVLVLNLVLYRCFSFGQRQSDCAGGYPGAPQSAGTAGCLFTCTPTSGGEDFSCWSGCLLHPVRSKADRQGLDLHSICELERLHYVSQHIPTNSNFMQRRLPWPSWQASISEP